MRKEMLENIDFFDPDIKGMMALFDVGEEQLRSFTFQYVDRSLKNKNRYQGLKLRDLCPGKKQKIIEILVRSLNKSPEEMLTEN